MIPLVKNRNTLYIKKTHKFGIEVPKSIVQVYALDKNNGNTLREDAIYKEMKDARPDFKKLESGDMVTIEYQRVNCHIIFDVNMEDFRCKARLVAGGHVTDSGHPELLHRSACHREDMESPRPGVWLMGGRP